MRLSALDKLIDKILRIPATRTHKDAVSSMNGRKRIRTWFQLPWELRQECVGSFRLIFAAFVWRHSPLKSKSELPFCEITIVTFAENGPILKHLGVAVKLS